MAPERTGSMIGPDLVPYVAVAGSVAVIACGPSWGPWAALLLVALVVTKHRISHGSAACRYPMLDRAPIRLLFFPVLPLALYGTAGWVLTRSFLWSLAIAAAAHCAVRISGLFWTRSSSLTSAEKKARQPTRAKSRQHRRAASMRNSG